MIRVCYYKGCGVVHGEKEPLSDKNTTHGQHLQRGNTIRKEVVNDDVVNPTRVTPSFAKEEEDEKINDCFNGFVCF